MSSVVISGDTSGAITLAAPAVAGTNTITLPASTGTTVIQNGSNNLLMNSGYGSDAVAYGCRAWVNFNGTGTVAIRASGNVSSITDNGTGDYTLNFATALVDTNYAPIISSNNNASNISVSNNNDYASERFAGSYRFAHLEAASLTDGSVMCVAIFR